MIDSIDDVLNKLRLELIALDNMDLVESINNARINRVKKLEQKEQIAQKLFKDMLSKPWSKL